MRSSKERLRRAQEQAFNEGVVWALEKEWMIPTVDVDGTTRYRTRPYFGPAENLPYAKKEK